jgi:outer membrane protein TolC
MSVSSPFFRGHAVLLGFALCAGPFVAQAQADRAAPPAALSLADALKLAGTVSHTVRTAEAGVMRARGQEYQARAQYFPQLNFSGGYQRTLESQFSAISKAGGSDSSSSSGSGSSSSGSSNNGLANISKIFAAPNTVTLGLNFSQSLFTAGKLTAANKGAEASRTAAQIGFDASKAQLVLDVAQAYFDAVASDQLVQIADSTLAQAERTLQQTTVSRQVGSAAEFDLLRARVARDNQRPVVIQARGNRELALLRLRQLLGIPLGQPLALTTPIRDDGAVDAEPKPLVLSQPIILPGGERGLVPDTSVGHRSSVRQAEANVTAQEFALRAARWERLPSFQITSLYQRFGYPAEGTILPNSFGAFYPNWTATLGFSFPVFTGGRLTGDRMQAEANLIEAKQTYEQTRELAALDARQALTQYEQTLAAYAASVGTDQQAAKAYSIAEVRFREGISTQVELQQSRTQYEQARLNRVTAARDLEVARLKVALLKDLPVGGSTASGRR